MRGQKPRLGQKAATGTRVGVLTACKAKLCLELQAVANPNPHYDDLSWQQQNNTVGAGQSLTIDAASGT